MKGREQTAEAGKAEAGQTGQGRVGIAGCGPVQF